MNKKEREFKQLLAAYEVPSPDADACETFIMLCREKSDIVKMKRTSNKQFILSQLGFIRKRTWLFQFMSLVTLIFMIDMSHDNLTYNKATLGLMAILGPLLLMINIDEISRIYNKSMLEIEFSTRYSLKQVLLTRLMILGMTSFMSLGVVVCLTGGIMGMHLFKVIIYAVVPFNLVCIGCLTLMKYFKGTSLNYACMSYSCILILMFVVGRNKFIDIYSPVNFINWVYLFVITFGTLGIQVKKMWERLDQYDEVMKEAV